MQGGQQSEEKGKEDEWSTDKMVRRNGMYCKERGMREENRGRERSRGVERSGGQRMGGEKGGE